MAEADKIAIGQYVFVGPTDALVVVDAMGTFMPGGGLAVPDGDMIVAPTRRVMSLFELRMRIALKDRHLRGSVSIVSSFRNMPAKTELALIDGAGGRDVVIDEMSGEVYAASFERRDALGSRIITLKPGDLAPHAKFNLTQLVEYLSQTPTRSQILWDEHGIAGTPEAELHPDLPESDFGYVLVKGLHPCEDSYSGFRGNAGTPTELADVLRDRGVTRIFVCGLALDYCVRFTAEDGKAAGFEVIVISDATRAVFPKKAGEVYASLREQGIRTMGSEDIFADRCPC